MKYLRISILLLMLILSLAANAQTSKSDSKVSSLFASVIRKYPNPSNFYALIQIGSNGYLIRGKSAKILKTKRLSYGFGGMCENYASFSMYASNSKMEELSEGEGSIWKFDGKTWKEIARTSAGDWVCQDVKNIPKQIRKCLYAGECY